MTSTAAQATRSNFRDFGAPESGTWHGRGKTAERYGTPVTIERHGRGLTVRNLAGAVVDSFGDTAKFWFVPAGTPAEDPAVVAARQAERDAAYAKAVAYLAKVDAIEADGRAANERETAARLADAGDQVAEPVETTWGAMGRPDTVVYYGQSWRREAPRLVRFNEYGNRMFDALTGAQIGHWGSDVRKVLAPVPVTQAVELATPAPAPVVIVPCGGKKAPGTLPASAKYVGSYHLMTRKAAAAIAERTGARILVLSARYGLLELTDLVDDYDMVMGDPGSVTAGRIAEQAAALGITDALVTVIAGKKYADVVTAVWPHAVRVLDGTNGMPHQMKRMAEVARGEWTPATAAAAAPALFGAELVAPDTTVVAAAGDLIKGDVLAPGTFGEQHADPVLVVAPARPVDQPGGRRRVTVMIRSLTFPGRGRHLVVWADAGVDVVGRERCKSGDWVHPPADEAEILDGPALSWPRLITGDLLRAGDIVAPGGFGPWNKVDTITVTTDPKYLDTVMGARRYDIGARVNLPTGPGPETHAVIANNQYIPVLERPAALEATPPDETALESPARRALSSSPASYVVGMTAAAPAARPARPHYSDPDFTAKRVAYIAAAMLDAIGDAIANSDARFPADVHPDVLGSLEDAGLPSSW